MQKKIKYLGLLLIGLTLSCSEEVETVSVKQAGFISNGLNQEIKSYWYNGQAEISSYRLKQARYGEMREGEAVCVFVSEPFSPKSMTKADRVSNDNISVLKCNFTKRFNTGIYPYSLMTSTFFPFENGSNSLKTSHSMQEWCGHVYMELDNLVKPELKVYSYFEGENQRTKLETKNLEDDLWSQIRINPNGIQQGEMKMLPSLAYLRFSHAAVKAYSCNINLKKQKDKSILTANYKELGRTLKIEFESAFPHKILGWEESYYSGFGSNRKLLSSSGELIKTIRSDYWNKHDNIHEGLRDTLGLKL